MFPQINSSHVFRITSAFCLDIVREMVLVLNVSAGDVTHCVAGSMLPAIYGLRAQAYIMLRSVTIITRYLVMWSFVQHDIGDCTFDFLKQL